MLDFEVKVMYQKKSELTRELKLWRSRERHVSTRDREQKFPISRNLIVRALIFNNTKTAKLGREGAHDLLRFSQLGGSKFCNLSFVRTRLAIASH